MSLPVEYSTTVDSVVNAETGFQIAGAAATAQYLRGNGTNIVLSALLAADLSGTVAITNGGTGQTTANAALNALLPSQTGNSGKILTTDGSNTSWGAAGSGTVTSVGLDGNSMFSITGSPVTTSGTLSIGLSNQSANTILAGPTTGAATTPTFRALVAADIPDISASKITSGTIDSARISGNYTNITRIGVQNAGIGVITGSNLVAFSGQISGDSSARIEIFTGGSILFGTGSSQDTTLARSSNGIMTINSAYILTATSSSKTTAGAPYTNDGYVTISINGTSIKVMTTA